MACIETILGFDIDSQQLACVNFRANPQKFYLSCDINSSLDQIIPCTAYTDPSCTIEVAQSGYFAFSSGFRYWSKPTGDQYSFTQLDTCDTSTKVKKCCGGDEIYNVVNLTAILGYEAPVGMIIDMSVAEGSKQFRTCFEVVDSSLISTVNLFANVINNIYQYGQCSNCMITLNNLDIQCYLSQGNYTFQNCKNEEKITLSISANRSNTIQVGDVVLFNNKCYFATLITPTLPVSGAATSVLVDACDNIACNPPPPAQPIKSMYVSGCCDSKIYRLKSMSSYLTGTTLSIAPGNFCYRVIPTPSVPDSALILNDVGFVKINTTGCDDKKCQPCPAGIIVQNPRRIENQCGIVTKSPLTVTCNVTDPTLQSPSGGILSVNIIGGTSPYEVTWISPGGQSVVGTTIFNRPAGTYTAIVKDKFGDFTKTITCKLTLPLDCNFDATISPVSALSCDSTVGIKGYAFSGNIVWDVETFLKYAEAVGLTQSAAVP